MSASSLLHPSHILSYRHKPFVSLAAYDLPENCLAAYDLPESCLAANDLLVTVLTRPQFA
jgi:hypothetical protein